MFNFIGRKFVGYLDTIKLLKLVESLNRRPNPKSILSRGSIGFSNFVNI